MRRRGAGWTVLLVLALALRAGPVARAVEEEEPLDLDTIVEIAEEDRGAAVAALVAADGLPEHAARALIEAVLARERMDDERVEPSAARLRAWEGALLDVLAAAPESGILAEALAPLSWSYEDAEAEASAARLAARVAGLPDPARTALLLNRELAGGAHARALLGLALDRRPRHPALLHAAAELTRDLAVRIELYETAWESLEAIDPAPPPAVIGLFAERRLAALLAAGAFDEAVAALGEVPGGLAALAGGARPEGESEAAAELVAEVGGLPVTGRQEDLRLELAALGWLAGDLDSARRLLDSAPAAEPEDEDPLEGTGPTRAVVDRLLGTQAGDPFDLFFGLAMASVGANWDEPVNALALRLAAAALAEGEGYPEVAVFLLESATERLEQGTGIAALLHAWGAPELPPLEPALERRIAARTEQLEALAAELRERRSLLLAAAAAGDPGAASIARSLAADPPRFVEQRLPAGIAPAPVEDMEAAYEASGLPEGLYLERLEREGSRVLAVAFDWRFGLWAVRSRDGGTTWDAPLATGLRPRDPYGVTGRSGLPMTGDGRLRLEVVLWPRFDPAVVPVDPEAATEPLARGLLLELPWADLERDRDGDGLTDLAEAWLLTDLGNPDGDGDGRADAVDPLPQVAHRPGCDARARALVAVLRDIDAMWFPNAGDGAPAGCSAGSGADLPAPHSAEVLVARRSWFAPLEPAARLVVLEEAELEAAGSRLGHLPPIRLRLFVFDRTGDRALAVWDDCGAGSILLLRRRGGGWEETTAFRFGGCVSMVEEPVEETEEP